MLKIFKEVPLVDMLVTDMDNDELRKTDLYISVNDRRVLSNQPARGRICAHCGKEFKITSHIISDYIYKEIYKGKRTYYCSWTCMSRNRKERKNENKRTKKRASKKTD